MARVRPTHDRGCPGALGRLPLAATAVLVLAAGGCAVETADDLSAAADLLSGDESPTAPGPSCDLSIDRNDIYPGSPALLEYTVTGAVKISINNGGLPETEVSGEQDAVSGTAVIRPRIPAQGDSITYQLTATDEGGLVGRCHATLDLDLTGRTSAVGIYAFNMANNKTRSEVDAIKAKRLDFVITDWRSAKYTLSPNEIFSYVVINAKRFARPPEQRTFYWVHPETGEPMDYEMIVDLMKDDPYVLGYYFNEPLTPAPADAQGGFVDGAGNEQSFEGGQMTPWEVRNWTRTIKRKHEGAEVHVIFASLPGCSRFGQSANGPPHLTAENLDILHRDDELGQFPPELQVDGYAVDPYAMMMDSPNVAMTAQSCDISHQPGYTRLSNASLEWLEGHVERLLHFARTRNKKATVITQAHKSFVIDRVPWRRPICQMANAAFAMHQRSGHQNVDLTVAPYLASYESGAKDIADEDRRVSHWIRESIDGDLQTVLCEGY
ncbi:MAG: hypothetical protein JRI23_15950 [Deltaproteobacteria bacterium]|jgi:hypothetical protein|nr:hypothetical protein [Deltaproteobacteria bacterium]MBW2533258.1 hypothetical protein [Deltaproteobacteria bacterium]